MEDIDKMTQTERDKQTVEKIERRCTVADENKEKGDYLPADELWQLLRIAREGLKFKEVVAREIRDLDFAYFSDMEGCDGDEFLRIDGAREALKYLTGQLKEAQG